MTFPVKYYKLTIMKTKKSKTQAKPDFTEPEYEALMEIIDLNRTELGKLCDVSPHAVSWWRSQGKIPRRHLKVLLSILIEKMRGHKLTPIEEKIMKVFIAKHLMTEEHLKQLRDGVTPDFMSPKTLDHYNDSEEYDAETQSPSHVEGSIASKLRDLTDYDLEELVDEIQNRGWIINLSRKEPT